MAYTTPSTVGGSDVLTAALWNTQIRDNFTYLKTATDSTLPRGIVAKASVTTVQYSVSTLTDITGLTTTFTADPLRIYVTTAYFEYQCTATQTYFAFITDGSNVVKATSGNYTPNAYRDRLHVSVYETGLSGSTTRKLRAQRETTGVFDTLSSTTAPAQIFVMDMGLA